MIWGRLLGLLLLVSPAGGALAGEPGQIFRRRITSADGTALALYRFAPAASDTTRPAVLLVPELGFGRESYDLAGSGLARYLQAKGYDTFIVEPRGAGSSSRGNFRLRDWVAQDLPAAVKAVQATHSGKVDLVVHGFGGALAVAAVPRELSGKVGRVVALAVPVAPEVPNQLTAAFLRGGGKFSQLGADPESARIFELLFARHGRFSRGRLEAFRGRGLSDLSPTAASELLGWMQTGDLPLPDGSSVAGRLSEYDRPTLQLLALLDNYSHPEFGSPMRQLCPKAQIAVGVLSKTELADEDYTHLSLLLGKDAADDVFSRIHLFLRGDAGAAVAEEEPAE